MNIFLPFQSASSCWIISLTFGSTDTDGDLGVLTKDLPSVRNFRPEMPPVVDDILRKMTQKVVCLFPRAHGQMHCVSRPAV